MSANAVSLRLPRTQAIRKALRVIRNEAAVADLLFLEAWETQPSSEVAAALRASQIRRANPLLVAEIRTELDCGRPLTQDERQAIAELV